MSDTYTIGKITQALGCYEWVARRLLNDAGSDPRLDELAANLDERVPRSLLINLIAMRAGDREGRLLARLLGRE